MHYCLIPLSRDGTKPVIARCLKLGTNGNFKASCLNPKGKWESRYYDCDDFTVIRFETHEETQDFIQRLNFLAGFTVEHEKFARRGKGRDAIGLLTAVTLNLAYVPGDLKTDENGVHYVERGVVQ